VSEPGRIEFSVSTWQQPIPPAPGPVRAAVIAQVADRVTPFRGRVRVAVDGLTAAGKTTFGHELAVVLAAEGRVVLRASIDDFKRPWTESHLYDRVSGEGYYRNAFDFEAIHRLLLQPARFGGCGDVALCSTDPITQIDQSHHLVTMPGDGVLVVDGVFALRDELIDDWDLRIWLDIDPELSIRRGISRDAVTLEEQRHAVDVHRDRYLAAELLYIDEIHPIAKADVVIDNTDIRTPVMIRC
jgi:uridine kinase